MCTLSDTGSQIHFTLHRALSCTFSKHFILVMMEQENWENSSGWNFVSTYRSSGDGKKPENPEEPHMNTGRTCKTQWAEVNLMRHSHMIRVRIPASTARLRLVPSLSSPSWTQGVAKSASSTADRPRSDADTMRARDVWMYATQRSNTSQTSIRRSKLDWFITLPLIWFILSYSLTQRGKISAYIFYLQLYK